MNDPRPAAAASDRADQPRDPTTHRTADHATGAPEGGSTGGGSVDGGSANGGSVDVGSVDQKILETLSRTDQYIQQIDPDLVVPIVDAADKHRSGAYGGLSTDGDVARRDPAVRSGRQPSAAAQPDPHVLKTDTRKRRSSRAELADKQSLIDCLNKIIAAPRHRDAVDALARQIAFECPGSVVRIAVGRRTIDHFFDHRLGWLPRGNSVRDGATVAYQNALRDQDLSQQFLIAPANIAANVSSVADAESDPRSKSRSPKSKSPPSQSPGSSPPGPSSGQYQTVDLSTSRIDHGDRRDGSAGASAATTRNVFVLMRPQTGETQFRGVPSWLSAGAGQLSAALASRPVRRLPRWVDFVGSRPMATLTIVALMVAGIGCWPVDYPVSATAIVTAKHPRIVAAPFDATLLSTAVQPGDTVRRGQTLVQLDGRPLRIELDSIESEVQSAAKDANIALATGQIAEAQRAQLQKNKLLHRRDLLRSRLQQLSILAPADGVVIGSDLRRHVGSPLTTGQRLMEIASLHDLTAEIEIPQFEINQVGRDAMTRLRIGAVGGPSYRGPLLSIDPAAVLRDDQSVFVGRMSLPNPDHRYRVGMTGDATVYGPVRPLAWAYLRPWFERALWALGY